MSKLIYIANVSLDGYIEDSHGKFDWSAPNDEVFAFITDLVRSTGTYLYGRRMYETMAVWETDPAVAAQSELMSDLKASAAKDSPWEARTSPRSFRSGLVDECQLFIHPVFVGAGKSSLPRDTRGDLELLDERRFSNGVVYVRYRVAS